MTLAEEHPRRADSFPSRVLFALHVFLAARLLPFQIANKDLDEVLRLAAPRRVGRYAGIPKGVVARTVARACRHPLLMRDRRCLRLAVLGHRFLAEAAYSPEIRFSIGRGEESALVGHCWVTIDGEPIVGSPSPGQTELRIERGAVRKGQHDS